MFDVKCPLCSSIGGTCGHLLASMDLEEFAVIDAGAVEEAGTLVESLQALVEECIRTGDSPDLGTEFYTMLEQVQSFVESGFDTPSAIEACEGQIHFALGDILATEKAVTQVDHEGRMFLWTSSPGKLIKRVESKLARMLKEVRKLDSVQGEESDPDK